MEIIQELRKVSLKDAEEEEETRRDSTRPPPPPDRFFLVQLMVFFLGMTSLLATTFVITANDYWMWKFRNTSLDGTNVMQRTDLQSTFVSSMSISMAVPSLLSLIFALTIAHKVKSRTRIIFSYSVLMTCFLVLTVFVEIDTDTWQVGLFGITMIIMAILSTMIVLVTSSLIVVVPKFPIGYLKLFLYGQGVSGIVSALVQIVSLSIGGTSQKVGLIYFGCGTALYAISLALYVISKYLPRYQYYVNEKEENTSKPMPTLTEMKNVFVRMWPILAVHALCLVTAATTHPNITSLIVSQNYGDNNAWSEKYFVPVITFLVADLVGTLGRVFASANLTYKNAKWFIIASAVRVFLFLPLFAFCNIKTSTRKLTPVFTHDWEYVIILSTFSITNAYITTAATLSVSNFKKKEDPMDLYYLILQATMMLLALGASPLSLVVLTFL